jgi:glyceraldehyde-3-phosphate dehydrogenase/erythrose-4-phosphate dehydrogenase
MKAILGVSNEPLVSSGFRADSRSSIIDSSMTIGDSRHAGEDDRLLRQ